MPDATPMSAGRRSKDAPMRREAPRHNELPTHKGRPMNKELPTNKEAPPNEDEPMNKDEPTRRLVKTGTHPVQPGSTFTQAWILEKRFASETNDAQGSSAYRSTTEKNSGSNPSRKWRPSVAPHGAK
jgi:hypothetical protein